MIFWNMQCIPMALQRASAVALTGTHEWIENNRQTLERRRDALRAGLSICSHTGSMPAEGGFFCFPAITHSGVSSLEFSRIVMKLSKVGVSPGCAYHGEGFVRISFAAREKELYNAGRHIANILLRG
jgi:aminotransferase